MNPSFEQALIEVWRQALMENAKTVELGSERYPVRRTPKRGLRHFPARPRQLCPARFGLGVLFQPSMQFLSEGRYVANVVDGKVNLYGKRSGTSR